MKKTIYALTGLVFALSLGFSAKANTAGSTCFTDGFGYVWTVSYAKDGPAHYSATGSVDLGGGVIWNVVGSATIRNSTGPVELSAINPSPDGCTSFTDSFAYYGTAVINRGVFSYTGTGSWESYCFGGVFNTGTWDAVGPCQAAAKQVITVGPARHTASSKFSKNSMNTVCFNDGFYNFLVTYTDQGGGYYTCTGTYTVDGTPWTVSGYGNFASKNGYVEFHVANPNPDGCFSYSDSFTYYGTASITGSGLGSTFNGSGDWTSYCFGGVLNTGTWAAYGPCSNNLKPSLFKNPAKHAKALDLKVSPNPMKSTSTLSYTLSKDSKVKITVYNYMQQPVKEIVNTTESAGKHSYIIDGSTLTNGVYRVVAMIDGQSVTTSLQVVK